MPIFGWWRNWKRKRWRAVETPEDWYIWLNRLWFFPRLNEQQQAAVIDTVKVLVPEKRWEGCGGLTMTDEVKVTISGQVGWLVAGLWPQYFDRVKSILVYPDAYEAPGMTQVGNGVVLVGNSARAGEAWYRGPVILSWEDVLRGGYDNNHGHNLVLHEFAHQLDMLNGPDVDGVPPIDDSDFAQRWLNIMEQEFETLVQSCEQGWGPFLDCYGATGREEFYAVVTEYFFQAPLELQMHHPELFDLLLQYYRVNMSAVQYD